MRKKHFSKLALVLGLVLSTALSSEASAAEDASASPDVPRPSSLRTGRGVAFGGDNGLFGRAYAQGIRVRIPIADHFAVNVRGLSALGDQGGDLGWYAGGRAEIVGHSPVYLNLVRLYGGGGPEVVTRLQGPGAGDRTAVGGGGQIGFEFFLRPGMSFFAEIGGRAGNELTGGGTALAGMMFYPFTQP